MLWWELESWPTKKWGIGEKRLRTPVLELLIVHYWRVSYFFNMVRIQCN